MQRLWFSLAGVSGFLGVLLAALSAHGDPARGAMVGQVAVLCGTHAPAFLAIGVWGRAPIVPALWVLGLTLFGGAVLARAFGGVSLGYVAPLGGLTLMAGWLALAVLAWRR